MSRRQIVVRLGLLGVFGILAFAFLSGAGAAPRGSTIRNGNEATDGRTVECGNFTLSVAVVGPLEPLGAMVANGNTIVVQDLIFDTFLMPDERGTLMSRVLRRWERIDNRHYRVQLDPELRFSDGAPVSIQDATVSLATQKLRGIVRGEWLEIEPLDPHILVEPALLFTILHKQTETGPLGTGPYRLVSQSPTASILERIRPVSRRIGHVEILAFPTPREVFARVLRGDANAAFGLDEHQLELAEGSTRLKPIRGLASSALTVVFNQRRLNRMMRRQIAATLPIADIARVYGGGCHPEVTAGISAQYQDLPPGRRLDVLTYQMSTAMDRSALLVRRALGRRGGEIVREGAPTFVERWNAGGFDILITSMGFWPDPVLAYLWRTGVPSNLSRYSNPRVDAAFDRGDYAAAKAELAADVPYIPICRRERIGVVDSRIKNPRMGWWGLLDTLQDWEVDE